MDSGRKKIRWENPSSPASTRSDLGQSLPAPDSNRSTELPQPRATANGEGKSHPVAAREIESLLTQALRLADIGTWEYHVAGRDFTWSDHFFRMLGLEPREGRVSIEDSCALIHADHRGRMWDDVARLVSSGEPIENEFNFVRPDGETRVFHSRAVPVREASGNVASIRGMSQDITNYKCVEDDLHRLSQQLMQLRDQERRRTARQLHETAVQSLAALKMTLTRLADSLPKGSPITRALRDSCLVLVTEAIQEVRLVSYLMHPPMLDVEGLSVTLKWFAEGFTRRSVIAVTVEADEAIGRFPQQIEISVFRIVQEALTNIHRHSGSTSAEIRLLREVSVLTLEVEDHGRGLPRDIGRGAIPNHSLGVGVSGMRERVAQLKGSFEISSRLGKGTLLRAVFPLSGVPNVKETNAARNKRSRNAKASKGLGEAL